MPPGEVLVLLAGCTLLQILFALYLPFALLIDLPLIVTLYIGWYTGPINGALWGSVFGLMRDVTGVLPYWGINGISKTLLGFLTAYLSRWVFLESLLGRILLIAVVSLLDGLLVAWLLNLFGPGWPDRTWQILLQQAAGTGLVGGAFFRAYDHYKFPEKDFTQIR